MSFRGATYTRVRFGYVYALHLCRVLVDKTPLVPLTGLLGRCSKIFARTFEVFRFIDQG
jgi:hypothetical protein